MAAKTAGPSEAAETSGSVGANEFSRETEAVETSGVVEGETPGATGAEAFDKDDSSRVDGEDETLGATETEETPGPGAVVAIESGTSASETSDLDEALGAIGADEIPTETEMGASDVNEASGAIGADETPTATESGATDVDKSSAADIGSSGSTVLLTFFFLDLPLFFRPDMVKAMGTEKKMERVNFAQLGQQQQRSTATG